MKRFIVLSASVLALPALALGSQATEYSFPTEMRVTIERGETPILKNKSSLVYPIVSKFSVNMPNGDSEFVLQDENGIDLQMVKDGDEYLLQDNIAVGEGVFFGPDSQTATKPIRVLLEGPINLGHVHFASGSAKLSEEARYVLGEMATQMFNSGLHSAFLVGKTDRSGGEAGNLALSLRRALVASRYLSMKLEDLGVNDPQITVENMGEYLSPVTGPINPYERKVSVLVYPKV